MKSKSWTNLILLLHDEKSFLVHTGKGALREENKLTLGEIIVVVLLEKSGDRVVVELRGHDVDRDVHLNVETLLHDVLDLSNRQENPFEKRLIYNKKARRERTRRKAKITIPLRNCRIKMGWLKAKDCQKTQTWPPDNKTRATFPSAISLQPAVLYFSLSSGSTSSEYM